MNKSVKFCPHKTHSPQKFLFCTKGHDYTILFRVAYFNSGSEIHKEYKSFIEVQSFHMQNKLEEVPVFNLTFKHLLASSSTFSIV